MAPRFPSPSQRALATELEQHGEEFRRKLAGIVHRTQVWRFATGQRRPEDKAKAAMAEASGGRVSRDGWLLDTERKELKRAHLGNGPTVKRRGGVRRRPTGSDGR